MQGHHARLKSTSSARSIRSAPGWAPAKHARRGGIIGRLRRRILAYTAVEFLSTHIPGTPVGPSEECLLLVNVRQVVGEVRYRFCSSCACGVITAISINKPFRDTGLGTRALSHLQARHPGALWQSTPSTGIKDDLLLHMRIPALPAPCPHAPAGA
ncbi:hypothetical protein ACFWC9_38520 [Streptomyces goshikiensis]|uniref:hypothetical protein n=1 Tax=Streptomyces goshikiensis TaxID=1942 RepID=UPI003697F5AD